MTDYRTRQRRARIKEICAPYVYPWLRSLGQAAKDAGAFPISLCDFYAPPEDKEVAGVVELLIPRDKRYDYIVALHNLLGESPSELVANRKFMEFNKSDSILSKGVMGLCHKDVFNILDWIWVVRCRRRLPLEQVVLSELGLIKKSHAEDLSDIAPEKQIKERLSMLVVKMGMRDGYGTGLWRYIEEDNLPLPPLKKLRDFVKCFYPDGRDLARWGMDNVARFMGFTTPTDILYAMWGYEHARTVIPTEIDTLEKKVMKWYGSLRVRVGLKCDLPTTSLFE